ncbi:hypothetical protein MD484_g5951, partial [Candolleomyces efflorescens]
MPKIFSSPFTSENAATAQKPRKNSTKSDKKTSTRPPHSLNSFILFRCAFMKVNPGGPGSGNRNKAALAAWNAMSDEERAPWVDLHLREKEENMRLHQQQQQQEVLPTQDPPAQQLAPSAAHQYSSGFGGFPQAFVQQPPPPPAFYYGGPVPIAQPQPTRGIQAFQTGFPLQAPAPQPQFSRTAQDPINTGLGLNSNLGSFNGPPRPDVWFGGRDHVAPFQPARVSFSDNSGASQLPRLETQRRASAPAYHHQYSANAGTLNAGTPCFLYGPQPQQNALGLFNIANTNQAQADYVYNFAASEQTFPVYPGNLSGVQDGLPFTDKGCYNGYPNQYGARTPQQQQQPAFSPFCGAPRQIPENEQSFAAAPGHLNETLNDTAYEGSTSSSSNDSDWNGVPCPGVPIDLTQVDPFTKPRASTSASTELGGSEAFLLLPQWFERQNASSQSG